MYRKCKCCVSIVANQQTTSKAEFQNIVTKIRKNTDSIKSNQNTKHKTESFTVRKVNRSLFDKWSDTMPTTVDSTVEEPYIPANIVHRMYGHSCKGIHHQIHTIDVVADMLAFNVHVIARNMTNTVVALVRTIETSGPTCTIDWHTKMVKNIRLGVSEFTDMLNRRYQKYYISQATKKSVDEIVDGIVEKKEVYFLPSKTLKKKRKARKTGYTRGPYKKKKKNVLAPL